jgi:hypothetical protein
MGRSANPFKGVNKVCAQCVHNCKQFENVILVNCPKFKSVRTETHLSSRRGKNAVVHVEGAKTTD